MPGSWSPSDLPNLDAGNHLITSPHTSRYNCIAWAANDDANWWWPVGRYFWPQNVPREETMDAFVRAYGTIGYVPCADGATELGFEKVVVYAKNEPGVGVIPTHAARQLANGRWTSKLGPCEDIDHQELASVEGPVYGNAAVYLKRPIRAIPNAC